MWYAGWSRIPIFDKLSRRLYQQGGHPSDWIEFNCRRYRVSLVKKKKITCINRCQNFVRSMISQNSVAFYFISHARYILQTLITLFTSFKRATHLSIPTRKLVYELEAIASFNGRDIERSRANNNAQEIVKLILTETRRWVLELQNGRAHCLVKCHQDRARIETTPYNQGTSFACRRTSHRTKSIDYRFLIERSSTAFRNKSPLQN